jgi:hypothetical protein
MDGRRTLIKRPNVRIALQQGLWITAADEPALAAYLQRTFGSLYFSTSPTGGCRHVAAFGRFARFPLSVVPIHTDVPFEFEFQNQSAVR